jgi:DNA end-binding protein Ku
MASTVWKGQLNFGFVSMPVKFTTAAKAEAVHFNQLHECRKSKPLHGAPLHGASAKPAAPLPEHSRCKQKMVCEAEGRDLERNDIVKGYEYEKDKYVVLTAGEISAIEPATSDSMDVMEFVKAGEVDPVFFESAYHLAPEVGGERAYALLYATMRATRMAAVTKIAMHGREHVAILRPGQRGIILQTLYYHDEVRMIQEFRTDCDLAQGNEIAMAAQLVKQMAAPWMPHKYSDGYRAKLKQLVEAKISGKPMAKEPKNGRKSTAAVIDISQALKLSMKRARKVNRG